MSEEITPALSPDEWGNVRVRDGAAVITLKWADGDVREMYAPTYHRIAALALHVQPFGFTAEDAADVEEWAAFLATRASEYGLDTEAHRRCMAQWERLTSLAKRIRAILPPALLAYAYSTQTLPPASLFPVDGVNPPGLVDHPNAPLPGLNATQPERREP